MNYSELDAIKAQGAKRLLIYKAIIQIGDIMPEIKMENCEVDLVFHKNVTSFLGFLRQAVSSVNYFANYSLVDFCTNYILLISW